MVQTRSTPDADAASWPALDSRARDLRQSATLAINERSAALRARGQTVHAMGLGQSPFPVPEMLVAELKKHAREKAYLPSAGLPELRRAVASYTRRTEGLDVDENQVIIGPGSKELMFILQLVSEREVLIPSPSWVSYAPQASLFAWSVRWLPTGFANGMRLKPEALAAACAADPDRPRLLILNYPNNPTGVSYSTTQLEELANVAADFDVLVLSDEIYSGLDFRGQHVSIARFYPQGTIVSNGLSKWCGAGGWRIGSFVVPHELTPLRDAMIAVASETFSSVSAPIQFAAIKGFSDDPEISQYLSAARAILAALLANAAQRLRDVGAHVCEPQGGFYLFPDYSTTARATSSQATSAVEFCQRALDEAGIAMLPGSEFGMPADSLTARLALVDFDGNNAMANFSREVTDDFLRRYCGSAVAGVNQLCDWLLDR